MTINAQTGLIQWTPLSANDGPNPVTVHAVDTGGAFDNQSYIVNVTDLNTIEGQKYALVATPPPPPPPAPPGPAGPTLPIVLAPITAIQGPNAVVYYPPNNSLIATHNYPAEHRHNFEQILSNGTVIPFGNASGFTDEVQIATALPGVNTGFQVGDLYTGNGHAGQIVKITNNGNTIDQSLDHPAGRERAVAWQSLDRPDGSLERRT